MKIYINEEAFEIKEDSKVTELLKHAGIQSSYGIAVAINDTVIPKTSWETKQITENDKVLIIRASQGG